jgi:hypothetical protein
MGFDLEIIFQGMCTFVPERDGSKLWVLMRDSIVPQDILTAHVPAHAAVIRFPLASLVPDTPGFGLRRMDHLDIKIAGQGQNGMQYTDFDVQTNQPIGTPGLRSFAWVSPLEEACVRRNLAGGGVIARRFVKPLGELTVQDADLLAARCVFTEGTVSTHKLAGLNGALLDSSFRPPTEGAALANDLSQPTAAMVSLKTFIDADAVTFESTTLRTDEMAPPLTLKPFGPQHKLTINILNEEAETLVRLQGPPIHLGEARAQDLIFLSMFEFCENPPALSDRPMPIPEKVSTRFPSPPSDIIIGGSPPCSPARGIPGS